MASVKLDKRNKFFLAKLADKIAPCAFCRREVDEETIYGKLYCIGNIHCHYFCVLLSCCLIQKGKDENGLFGFLFPDILAEIERSKKHKCSYCNREGATLGCSVASCKKQFHLPCGRERNAVSLFYGNYKSFCENHVPKQKIPENIMEKAQVRKRLQKKRLSNVGLGNKKHVSDFSDTDITEIVCVICYEPVDGFPTSQTFWPPCCGRDAWFHRNCLQRMALSAGIHYLKCPLCNDKDNFYDAVLDQGYYIPDRDAAWELEQNAFSEIYERSFSCNLEKCLCPKGREFDSDTGNWDILVCVLCGSYGAHAWCKKQADASEEADRQAIPKDTGKEDNMRLQVTENSHEEFHAKAYLEATVDFQSIADSQAISEERAIAASEAVVDLQEVAKSLGEAETAVFQGPYVCSSCAPSASDAPNLVAVLHALALQESNTNSREEQQSSGPRMPCRMSIRRTKPRRTLRETPSSSNDANTDVEVKREVSTNTELSRLELNLKTPRKRLIEPNILKTIETKLISPIKLLEQGLNEHITRMNLENFDFDSAKVVDCVRRKFGRPKPLGVKKKIVNSILEELLSYPKEKPKIKEPLREWNSPKKSELTMLEDQLKIEKSEESPLVDTIKKIIDSFESRTKTIDIQNDSAMEISENDEIINVDLVKINSGNEKSPNLTLKSPAKTQRCSFKFSPTDKEKLQNKDLGLDIESFKNHYLTEVDKSLFCQNHKHIENDVTTKKLRTAIDFAIDVYNGAEKRKLEENDVEIPNKKQNSNIVLTYDTEKKRKKKKDLLIRNKNIKVKIRWKKEKLKLKITEKTDKRKRDAKIKISNLKDSKHSSKASKNIKKSSNKRVKISSKKCSASFDETSRNTLEKVSPKSIKGNRNSFNGDSPKSSKPGRPKSVDGSSPKSPSEESPKVLKQYVLNYNFGSISNVVVKPENNLSPIKKKIIKKEKMADNLKQMSLDSFFKRKSE